MTAMLAGGAALAIKLGYGTVVYLERNEEHGTTASQTSEAVSNAAKLRPRDEMGRLGSGNQMGQTVMDKFRETDVVVPADGGKRELPGALTLPTDPKGLVIFAHGSGSSRHSPRNRLVAANLAAQGFATLLFDLLTETEASDRTNVFDIPLLARRVAEAAEWARRDRTVGSLPFGLFGASTGAAAALVAAAAMPGEIRAVVSRGGRPDLAGDSLPQVKAPTLLIVGGADHCVIELNQAAHATLTCEARLEVVPGATHLFVEPGAMAEVQRLAAGWFESWLAAPDADS